MPELPESDAMRLVIERECLNRTIEAAELGSNTSYIKLPGSNERARLVGHQFTRTDRHGKFIFAGSKTGPWMVVHLGMTGKLIAFDAPDEAPDHTKFLIRFEGDRRLAFRCPRKLGRVEIVDDPESFIAEGGYGPDALEISHQDFVERIGGTNGAIKSALMSQKKLAGIGNLWSDEIDYRLGLDPERTAHELGEDCLSRAYDAMRDILRAVLDTEATYSKLPKDWLVRNRKKGADCPKCGGTIAARKVGGRTAYYCPSHQE
ncbi:DNA-formamidopyrimidine glycosylase [Erythrobacter sp. 3-20A1M]|uniref:DNA-formamidopyrimidine glycosylase family protein n=1 Tax=Erythrobacter sp. 3-20A1M TaxID=2653850 RepID=UPI001BFBF6EB|nr:DNA-formamidopyrimidine glycosylase family protein [Erythrobacter sp. 3-20A1M]QWC58016.1 DNA-formamidopyrimidine glycosylase [Erythrobacter sp. 3-20A1M]